jgi:hypothetical protein
VADRLFGEEAVLHLMGVQIASEKRRNPWTSQAARDRRSEIGVPSERRMSQTVCSRKKHGQAHDGLGGRGGAVAVVATTRRARGVFCSESEALIDKADCDSATSPDRGERCAWEGHDGS